MTLIADLSAWLAVMSKAGVTFSVDARYRLHANAPIGVITREIKDQIAQNKPQLVDALRLSGCSGCKRREFRDVPIHGGRSIRRDCRRCGLTAGFPVWNPLKGRVDVKSLLPGAPITATLSVTNVGSLARGARQ